VQKRRKNENKRLLISLIKEAVLEECLAVDRGPRTSPRPPDTLLRLPSGWRERIKQSLLVSLIKENRKDKQSLEKGKAGGRPEFDSVAYMLLGKFCDKLGTIRVS
jgi:hypothetical protein